MAAQANPFAPVATVQPGDNLYRIAMVYLGDARQWNRIAELNLAALGGVPDPFIQPGTFTTLTLPPIRKSATSGIYGQ
ncbi:MAG: LysM peptidoglycan-binding domain-containing protein [Dyella sp.]|nr:LysM peptidoglycan-binding domain-containing protein [Dyella sp.]